MPLYMYDAAYAPSLAAAKAHGAVAMSHYMTRSYSGTSPQPAATLAAGMGVNHNFEGYANELVGASRAKGQQIGREALAALPHTTPRNGTVSIKYSVDVDLTNLAACDQAFRGINDVHKGTGVLVACYAEGGLIERLHSLGLVQGRQWLSMSEGFGDFAHALRSGLVGIVQMHDAAGNWIGSDLPGTDRNTIIAPRDSGIEWPAGSPYLSHPTPAPAPDLLEEIMSLPGAPKGLTYQKLVADIAQAVFDHELTNELGKPATFAAFVRDSHNIRLIDVQRKVAALLARKP